MIPSARDARAKLIGGVDHPRVELIEGSDGYHIAIDERVVARCWELIDALGLAEAAAAACGSALYVTAAR